MSTGGMCSSVKVLVTKSTLASSSPVALGDEPAEGVVDEVEADVRVDVDDGLALDAHRPHADRRDQVPAGAELVAVQRRTVDAGTDATERLEVLDAHLRVPVEVTL